VLSEPFPVDRKGEVPEGKQATYDMPIFHRHGAAVGEGEGEGAVACAGGGVKHTPLTPL